MGTKMSVNRPVSGGTSGFSLTYNEVTALVDVPAQSTVYSALDAGSHRYELKTALAEPNLASVIGIRVDDRATGGDACYTSRPKAIEKTRIYDIVNVPITDKTGQKKIHAFIQNSSSVAVKVRVVFKIIPLEGGN
ncbi:hypothetical protein [Staphylococcus aureus]|uniref:hypothetical protein n=1 Tax=Staphylococcus aureus TaxID=1280 RepID=UPI0020BE5F8E|nr:hypothetical protein [Staphylococcus aureus]